MLFIGMLLVLVATISIIVINNQDGVLAEDVSTNETASSFLSGNFSSKLDFLNEADGQAYAWSDLSSDEYVNYKATGEYSSVVHHTAGTSIYVGAKCDVGNAVRTLYCYDNGAGGYDCYKDMFANVYYISKTGDYLYLSDFYNHNDDFYFLYMCYEFEKSTTPTEEERNIWVQSTNTCVTPTDAIGIGGVSSFDSESDCLAYVDKINGEDDSSSTSESKYGYFTNVKIPDTAETYSTITITATFVPAMDYDDLLIEAQIDQQSFQAFSVVESSASACDSSTFFASKFIDVNKGEPVDIKFTVNTGSREGDFDVLLYAVKGCYSDVGYDSEYSKNVVTDDIAISLKETSSGGDWDNDNVDNDFDNCPFNDNPKQEDYDNDNVGDACDFCPMDYGIKYIGQEDDGDYIGCHPCEGKAETDSCWDNSDYDKYTDPRYDEDSETSLSGEGSDYEQYFEDYIEQLKAKAEAELEESCLANGGTFEDGSCIVDNSYGETGNDGPVEMTDAEKCEASGGVYDGTDCIDENVLEESACVSAGGTWTNDKCVVDTSSYVPDDNDDTTYSLGNSYCGDSVCASDENIFTCAFDCSEDKSCNSGDVTYITCPTGEQKVGEICVDGSFTDAGNTCIESDGSFYEENKGSVITSGVILLIILAGAFIL